MTRYPPRSLQDGKAEALGGARAQGEAAGGELGLASGLAAPNSVLFSHPLFTIRVCGGCWQEPPGPCIKPEGLRAWLLEGGLPASPGIALAEGAPQAACGIA